MSFALTFMCVLIILAISYRVYLMGKVKRRLKWMTSVSGWPILGNIFEIGSVQAALDNICKLVKANGKLLILDLATQPTILATDYEFVEFVLSSQNILKKSEDYRYLRNWLGSGLITSDGTKWKSHRRMITPAFHFSILEKFISTFERNGKLLIEKLDSTVGQDSFDIYPFINLFALDIICETAMGVSINAQHQESNYVTSVKELCRILIERTRSLHKRSDYLYKFSRDYYKEKRALKTLHSVTYGVIDSRSEKLRPCKIPENTGINNNKDNAVGRKSKYEFLDILLKAKDGDGNPLSRDDIREEVDTFMFAGHDTTSSALSFALYLLSSHPHVQNMVMEEQKQIFGDDLFRDSRYHDLQEMKYLEKVVKETLRLYPPVPIIARCTDEPVMYKGNIIPSGLNIVLYIYGIHRDADNFVNPEKYDPSRFDEYDGRKPFSFVPFSGGPRNCIGQKFAMLEIKSAISRIVRNFVLLPAIPEHKLKLIPEAVLKSKNGIRVKLSRRCR